MSDSHETSSLDARELLVRGLDDFHQRKYEIGRDFQTLWGILDIYLQSLEPVSGAIPTKENPVISLELHSPQYRETRKKVFLQITRSEGFDIEKLQTIQIDRNGILHLNFKDSSRTINLIESWNNALLPRLSTESVLGKSREGMRQLEQSLDAESYFGGSTILTYAPATAIVAGGAHSAAYTIKQITFRNTATNRSETIPLQDSPVGTKNNLGKNVLKIMERMGYMYDVNSRGFFHPIERTLGETRDVIKKLSYEEYIKDRSNNTVTREQFEGMKRTIATRIDVRPPNLTWSQYLEGISKSIGKQAGELVFFPVFFHEYSKYQNTMTAFQGAGEMGLFMAGSRLGARIPAPPLLRPLISLAAGGATVVLGDTGAQALDGNKKKWQYLYQDGFGSLYTSGKSYAGHLAGNLGIFNMSEYADLINKGGTKLAELTGIASDDMDIGVPRVEMPLPGGSYLGTIPEITWFQSNISLGTNPWDWLRGAMGRDIDDWNKKVGQYDIRLKRAVGDILGKYYRDESMFASNSQKEKYGGKDGVLREHLRDILSGGADGHAFESEKDALIETIVAEAKKGNNKTTTETINQHIDNRVNQMVIDDFFIQERTKALNLRRVSFEGMMQQISTDSKIQQFLRDIPNRMFQDKELVADGRWEEYRAPLTAEKLKRFIPSDENRLFQSLLDDKSEINIDFQGGRANMERGRAFAMYLDTVLDYKREMEFINEIKGGNKKGIRWSLI